MIRLGIVDFDTSHVVAFTQRLNHVDVPEDQWVEGAQVVIGCAGSSQIAPDRIPEYARQLEQYGVELVERPEDMIGRIDGVLIESLAGDRHLERVRPFLEAGVPAFVDKPFACSVADAREMVALSRSHHVPIFSSSSLRYAPEVVEFVRDEGDRPLNAGGPPPPHGTIHGASTYGPAPLDPGNPGLFHYGIHPVEMLFTLMGAGCRWLTCVKSDGAEEVTGYWEGGRVGSVRGIRAGRADYGFTAFCENAVEHRTVGTQYIYRELLKQIVGMFETGRAPIEPEETLEIVAFIVAALESVDNGGRPVNLDLE